MPEGMPTEEQGVQSYTEGVPQEGKQVDPNFQKKVDGYSTIITKLLHSEKTRDKVVDMIKSSTDPFAAVPQAAMTVNDMAVNMMEQSGKQVDFGVQIAASPILIGDLLELGVATKQWEPVDEGETEAIMEDTFQMAIERGLEDGSIDPIQLQAEIEPLMNEDQKRFGATVGKEAGTPIQPNQNAIIDQIANDKVRKNEARNAKKAALKKQSALGGQ